jgi:hypothetical protein
VLEQLPTSIGNVEQFARLLPAATTAASGATTNLNDLIASVRLRLAGILERLAVPEQTRLVGAEVVLGSPDSATLLVAYSAETELPAAARQILSRVTLLLNRYPQLRALIARGATDSLAAAEARSALLGRGIDSARVLIRTDTLGGVLVRLITADTTRLR